MKNLIDEVITNKMYFDIYDDGTAALTETDKDITEAVIPRTVGGVPVTAIGFCAFDGCTELKSVTFPEFDYDAWLNDERGLEEIGSNAFMSCTALTEITIPASVKTICHGAFYRCSSLKKVMLEEGPGYPPYLEPCVFASCTSLTEIPRVRYASESLFDGCEALTYLPITDDVTSIDESCFAHCTSLTEVVIPRSVTSIEQLAFRSCHNLKKVTFENPDGWLTTNRYSRSEAPVSLDLSDPERNARWLRTMDFDDGVIRWYRKTKA